MSVWPDFDDLAVAFFAKIARSVWWRSIVPRRISNPIGMTAIVVALFASGASIGAPTDNARADDCLTAPKSFTPERGHWYYRTDRATQRQCWYLRVDQSGQPPAGLAMANAAPAASEPPVTKSATWQHHPDLVSDQELEQDKTRCDNKENSGPVGAGSPEFKLFLLFTQCMHAAGYEPVLPAQ
jgi:hypothetical protein